MADAGTSRETVLAAALALGPTTDTANATADAGDLDPDQAQAHAAALPATAAGDTAREATLPRGTSTPAAGAVAAEHPRLVSAAAATLAATAGRTHAHPRSLEASAMREDPSLLELPLLKSLKDRPRSPLLKLELTQKNKPTEACCGNSNIMKYFLIPPESLTHSLCKVSNQPSM